MRNLLLVACGVVLWTEAAVASETADVSLSKEVDRYLEQAQPEGASPDTLRVFWNKGIKMETADGNFKLSIFGRLMFDSLWWSSSDLNALTGDSDSTEDSFFFRRTRLGVGGTVYKNVIFKIQIDFSGEEEFIDDVEDTDADGQFDDSGSDDVGNVVLKDVYVGLKNLTTLNLTFKAGHQYQPFGLEELTSSKYITFMERSAPGNAFVPSRDTGFTVEGFFFEKRMSAKIGLFGKSSDRGIKMEDGGYHLTFRVTGLFIQNEDEGMLLHGGFGFTFRDTDDDMDRFRTRPGTGKGSRYVDTGTLAADDVIVFNFELLFIWKSFHAQLEFFMADVDAPSGVALEPQFNGWYVEVAYWITGESTQYKGSLRSRTSPKNNFHGGGDGGWGAWQVAFRFDTIDLDDDGIPGGKQDTFTIGVNWHWNPNTRVMFNVVFAQVEYEADPDIDIEIFQMRFQFDF